MARQFKTQLTGQIGESLAVAELGRRGIVATAFAGNVPDIDILAYADGRTAHLQVKTWRAGTLHINAARFLEIEMHGDRQIIRGLDRALDPNLIYICIRLGEQLGEDRFFILYQRDLQSIVYENHKAWLSKHDGVRPRNPESTHVSVSLDSFEKFESNWALIEKALGLP